MWAAIQSDLLDFVSTIKEDTKRVISKAAGETDEDDEGLSHRQKLLQDLKRSFESYGTPLDDQHAKGFEKFMRTFSLSSQGADIAQLLDVEPDVSRYYAELVPTQISPDLFWARYFYRVQLVSRGGVVSLEDEDEDEEMPWESSASEGLSPGPGPAGLAQAAAGRTQGELVARLAQLEQENAQLRGHIKVLVGRVNELEKNQSDSARPTEPEPEPVAAPAPAPVAAPAAAPAPVAALARPTTPPAAPRADLVSLDTPGDVVSDANNMPEPAPAAGVSSTASTGLALASLADEEDDDDWG